MIKKAFRLLEILLEIFERKDNKMERIESRTVSPAWEASQKKYVRVLDYIAECHPEGAEKSDIIERLELRHGRVYTISEINVVLGNLIGIGFIKHVEKTGRYICTGNGLDESKAIRMVEPHLLRPIPQRMHRVARS